MFTLRPHTTQVPAGWDEVGAFAGEGYGSTEVDLRYESTTGGRLEVTLAPIRRFIDPVPVRGFSAPGTTYDAVRFKQLLIWAVGCRC